MGGCCSVEEDENNYRQPRTVPNTQRQFSATSVYDQGQRVQLTEWEEIVRRQLAQKQTIGHAGNLSVIQRVPSPQKSEPLYGEFKCPCGRFWRSLLSWRDGYQICKHCKTKVYPKNQREVLPTDRNRDQEEVGQHPREFCQKCKELGRYCGKYYRTNYA